MKSFVTNPKNRPNLFYGWWLVLFCSFLNLYVGGVIFFGFTAFFEPIADTFGWSHTQISFAISLQGLEMGIFAPIAGILVDRIGPKKLILWGLLITGTGLLMLSAVRTLAMFYLAFLLISFGAGGCTAVVTITAVANWFNKKISLAMGLMGAGNGAGGLMVILIVWLIERFQWRITLAMLGVGMLLMIVPMAMVFRNRPEDMGLYPDGMPAPSEESEDAIDLNKQKPLDLDLSLGEAMKSKSFILLNIAEAMRMMAIPAVIVHVMPYLGSVGISRNISGMVAAAIPLVGIAGRLGFGWIGDRFDKRYVLAFTFGLLCLGIFSFGFAATPVFIIPFLIGFPIGHGGSMVVRSAIVREFFGRKAYGKLIGIILGAGAVGGVTGPTAAGWIYDTFGDYHFFWLALSAFILIATILVLQLNPRK